MESYSQNTKGVHFARTFIEFLCVLREVIKDLPSLILTSKSRHANRARYNPTVKP